MVMEHEHALEPGHRLQEYEIVRLLGHGGFGITYLAYDTHLDQHVALKEYLPNDFAVRRQDTSVVAKSSTDQEDFDWGLRTFLNEAKTLARFKHPNLIQVYRYLEAHNTAYIVMEYAEGQTLSEILKAQKTLSEPDLKGLLYPLLDGLEQVHRVGILHRDIKPGNIIIRDKDQSPVLIDFGAARHALGAKSKSLTSIITAGYSPIEQYTSKGKQGPWTDIYSLGAVCYRAITGEAAEEAADRILNDELIPAVEAGKGKASDVFLRAIDVALRNRHEERPQMISEWRTMLLDEGVTGFENSQGKEPILDEIITEQNKDHERVITLDNESPDREEEAEINLDNIEGNSQRTNKKKPVLPDYEGLPPPKNYHKYIATLVIVCLLGAGLFYLSDYRKKPESIPVIPDNEIVETEDVQIEQEAEELISKINDVLNGDANRESRKELDLLLNLYEKDFQEDVGYLPVRFEMRVGEFEQKIIENELISQLERAINNKSREEAEEILVELSQNKPYRTEKIRELKERFFKELNLQEKEWDSFKESLIDIAINVLKEIFKDNNVDREIALSNKVAELKNQFSTFESSDFALSDFHSIEQLITNLSEILLRDFTLEERIPVVDKIIASINEIQSVEPFSLALLDDSDPVHKIFEAWGGLDVDLYMNQWSRDAVQFSNNYYRNYQDINNKRTHDFKHKYQKVVVNKLVVGSILDMKYFAVINVDYSMSYVRANGSKFNEKNSEIYFLTYSSVENRWFIEVNYDYLSQ